MFEEYVNKFYEEIINDKDFHGNFFNARLNAISIARSYTYLKSLLEKGNKNE